jgi:hypothetical protein
MDIDDANGIAVNRMMDARPVLKGVGRAADIIPGMKDNLLLHAGPPIEWGRMAGPLQGAVIGALILEGLAKNEAEATALAKSGNIEFAPNHEHDAVGPMAGVISPSMQVYIIENITHGNKAYSNFNEGYGKVLRMGAFSDDVIARLRWINTIFASVITDAIAASRDGLDIRALLSEALHMGDEGHNRNKAGSLLYMRWLAPLVAKVTQDPAVEADVLQFLGDNALSVLNPVMAACKAMADAAHNIEGSTMVSTMARNGTDFGLRVSGLGNRWFTAPCETPQGLWFPGYTAADANPDIGDSTITETVGIGGFAMATAPAIVSFVGSTPKEATHATLEMYEITLTEHKHFTIPALEFRGTPTGIDIRKVVEKGIRPRINTGVAHRKAGIGQVGAGLVRPPMQIFEDALVAFAEKYDL